MPGRIGRKQKNGSVHEVIYPTEYEPPLFDAESMKEELEKTSFPHNPAMPTAFETKNVGSTMECEPTIR